MSPGEPNARDKEVSGTDGPTRPPTNAPGANPESPASALRRWWVVPVKVVLTVGVTWLILRGAGFTLAEAWEVDWGVVRPNAAMLALSAVLVLATFAVTAWLWSRVLVAIGGPSVPIAQGAAIMLVANLGRYVPGKVMQLAGLLVVARRAGLSGVHATSAAIVAQMLNLTGAVMVGGWVAYGAGPGGRWGVAAGLGVAVALTAFLYFGGARVLLGRILRGFGHDADLPASLGGHLLRWLPGYILNWLLFGAAFACLTRGLGLPLPLGTATTAFAAAYFLGYLAFFSPAGLGIRESTLAGFLTPVLGLDASLVLAALQRVWITIIEIAGAIAGALILRRPGTLAPARTGRGARRADDPADAPAAPDPAAERGTTAEGAA